MRPRGLVEALLFVLPSLLLGGGCSDPHSTRCGNLWCPAGTTCTRDQTRCVSPRQLSACQDRQDNVACTIAGAAEALCIGGACTAVSCGDGVLAGDEICDDGNIRSCDGCSADCRSNESCGNEMVDCSEECDRGDGNSDAPNAACRPDCRRQRCGDEIVDTESGEDCDGTASATSSCSDFGFYGGTLACSSACRNDTTQCEASCGDGIVTGSEICDAVWSTSQSCLDFGYDVGSLTCSAFCTPSFVRCEQQGFQSMQISNVSPFLYGVWGAGPNDVFAFGQEIILHYDGVTWSNMDLDGVARSADDIDAFLGMWGSSGSDVFAVGYLGVIAHYDGSVWTDMQSGVTESLNAVWGAASDDVFAVGNAATLLHFDGSAWTAFDAPDPSHEYYRVWGSSHSNVYATHAAGVDHFDGNKWSALTTPLGSFARLWGSGARDIFAVGDGANVFHFDGSAWSLMDQTATTRTLLHVSGTGPHDVYASGDHGTIIHYDGERWSPVPTATSRPIDSVWCAGPDDVFASTSLDISHLGQSGPTLRDIQTGTTESLLSVWITAPDDVTVVGTSGTIMQFDGNSWTQQSSPRDDDFSAIWAADATHKWATGYKYGAVYQFDGTAWTEATLPTSSPLAAISGRSANDVFAVGEKGVILHFDGTSWNTEDSGTTKDFTSLWGFENGDVFAGSFGGLIVRRTSDARWQTIVDEPASDFWGLWGSSPERLVVAADTHAAFLDNQNYRTMPLGAGVLVDSIAGTGENDIFGIPVGALGLYHFDGRDWAPLRLSTAVSTVQDIAMGHERGYIVGAEGLIIEIDRHCASQERNCADRWDNDCDGLVNCSDPDCIDNPACAQGACVERATLACNESFSGKTTSGSATFSIYPCAARSQAGREVFHRFSTEASGSITVSLTPEGADLDLIVLGSAVAGGCDVAGACIAASSTTDTTERVTFDAVAGETYYLAVDGHEQQAFAPYTLTIECP